MSQVEVYRGTCPVVLGFPHTGTDLPDTILEQLKHEARSLRDTDWHVETLYKDLLPDATTVRATFHRYVIDANRAPEDSSLYPGQNTTALVPLTDFDGNDLWINPPSAEEVQRRRNTYHVPYHAALQGELERLLNLHGIAILFDCHSIRSKIPFLFEGTLPDLNIGTHDGASCAPELEQRVSKFCDKQKQYSSVVNGRFKGGWTTRHYGNPEAGVHAVQMELAQSTYLQSEAPPFTYNRIKAEQLRGVLKPLLESLNEYVYSQKTTTDKQS